MLWHWYDRPELPEVATDRIGKLGQLPDNEVPRPMAHQNRLLHRGPDEYETHHQPLDGRTGRLHICSLALAPLDDGLDLRWPDDTLLMSKPCHLACPKVGPATYPLVILAKTPLSLHRFQQF